MLSPCLQQTCHRSVSGGKLLTTESMPLESWRQVLRSACKPHSSTSPVSGSWSQFCRCGCSSNSKAVPRVTGHKPPASSAARIFLTSCCIDRGLPSEHRNNGPASRRCRARYTSIAVIGHKAVPVLPRWISTLCRNGSVFLTAWA